MTSDLAVELYAGAAAGWVAPTVYTRSNVVINRGALNESSAATPSTCAFELDNRSGNWDPRNPTSPYYGQIGKGTPLRVALTTITDTFNRTVSNGWGSAPGGQAWSTGGNGGTSADFAVNGTTATHSVNGTVSYRYTTLAESYLDVDVRVDVSVLPGVNVTGNQVEPANILLRYQNSTSYYLVRVAIATDQSVNIGLQHFDGSIIAAQVTVAGLTHSGGNVLRVRAQAEGQSLRAKVWDAAQPEPYDWQVSGNYVSSGVTQINTAGQVGVRSGVGSGNTNTAPIVFSYSNFVVRVPRFAGEVGTFTQGADQSNQDRWVDVDAGGVLRRLGQGQTPLQSTLRRSIPTLGSSLVAYWPCEDGASSTFIASGIGGPPMGFTSAQLAGYSGFACSAPVINTQASPIQGSVPIYPSTGAAQIRFLAAFPANGFSTQPAIVDIGVTGSLKFWRLSYTTGGGLNLQAYDTAGNQVLNSTVAFSMNGFSGRISVQFSQSGSDIAYTVSTYAIGASFASYVNGTLTGQTVGTVTAVTISPTGTLSGVGIGHITVESTVTDIFALNAQLNAYAGESAADRITRLCSENSVPCDTVFDPALTVNSALMGPQKVDNLLNLLNEAANADMGQLTETRGTSGLLYVQLGAHYNLPTALTIDGAAKQLSAPPQPVDDDQQTHNDVTVTRTGGSSARATLTAGRLSTQTPAQGGIGTYAQTETLNLSADGQLTDAANWLLHLGTVDAARYPVLSTRSTRPPSTAGRAQYLAMLAVTMPGKIQVNNIAPDPVRVLVRGLTETLSPFLIDLQFNCVPASPYDIFTLDDTVLGRLDSDTTTLHAPIGSTDTSFQVDIGDGTLWTTNTADWPVLIRIGGEVMSVGSISGTSSPQTFSSVTRSVNGVVKSHTTGEQVNVAQPVYLALGRP